MIMLLLFAAGPPSAQFSPSMAGQTANTWVKRSPWPWTPPSPRLGYEGTLDYDPIHKKIVRWGGHNQGGGGEQNAETWSFDPVSLRWRHQDNNDAAPGICCGQQNVFAPDVGRFIRFAAFSGSHGWQWGREIALKNTSVWAFDTGRNVWHDRRPVPEPRTSPLRCASWDSDHGVIVVFGGEGNSEGTQVYDPHTNTWTRMDPPEQPAFRSGGNMAYDAARRLHILFGSQFTEDRHTWAYDIRTNRWTSLKPGSLPPTNQNDAVLTYDPHNRVILAVIRQQDGKGEGAKARLETWAFDAGKRTWAKMNPPREPDATGSRARLLTFLPDHGVALLENRTSRPAEQQIWTYRYAHAKKADPAPARARAEVAKGRVTLRWDPVPTRLVVLRGEGGVPWRVSYKKVGEAAAGAESFEDRGVKAGVVYSYRLQVEDADLRLGAMTPPVWARPPVPDYLQVSAMKGSVELAWVGDNIDGMGIHVERAVVEVYADDQLKAVKARTAPLATPSVAAIRRIGPFTRLTDKPITGKTFTDRIDLTRPAAIAGKALWERERPKAEVDAEGKGYGLAVYAYRIRAVNALGVEGGPSAYALTIPAPVQSVESRERGTACDLRWAKSEAKGLMGYRVYRLDGRYDKQPVTRLTAEPVRGTEYTDRSAGKVARRYHVIAVDALGQEGLPSAPVWFEREWKAFYKPFIGEWHQ